MPERYDVVRRPKRPLQSDFEHVGRDMSKRYSSTRIEVSRPTDICINGSWDDPVEDYAVIIKSYARGTYTYLEIPIRDLQDISVYYFKDLVNGDRMIGKNNNLMFRTVSGTVIVVYWITERLMERLVGVFTKYGVKIDNLQIVEEKNIDVI